MWGKKCFLARKESAYLAGDPDLIPGLGRSPGEGNGRSSILAWRIPWTEEPGGPQSMGSQESDMTDQLAQLQTEKA